MLRLLPLVTPLCTHERIIERLSSRALSSLTLTCPPFPSFLLYCSAPLCIVLERCLLGEPCRRMGCTAARSSAPSVRPPVRAGRLRASLAPRRSLLSALYLLYLGGNSRNPTGGKYPDCEGESTKRRKKEKMTRTRDARGNERSHDASLAKSSAEATPTSP